jgi:adenine specific DNA methylase Mod
MLQESLELSKQLLHPDGSIWVHLDDHEQHRARLVLDEVFGEDAFIATIIWDNFYKLHERAVISPSHNYIHVYAPSKKDGWAKVRNLLPEDTESGPLPLTVWYSNDTGHFQEAKEEATRLFAGDTVFTTPKPERLLQRIIQIATNPDDTVLDYFAGSGTTAAVAHKMGRRWVTVERSDSTIAKYTRPRLERVIDGEPGGISGPIHWTGGGGFKYLVST